MGSTPFLNRCSPRWRDLYTYRRYKKGHEYEVLGVAGHSETEEELVVYRALYGERDLWVRPMAMFVEPVMVEGLLHPRFQRLPDEPTG
jgi:hypothetical protein